MSINSDPRHWRDPRHRMGWRGEEVAKTFLMRRGWSILAHRFRLGRVEVDLVAQRGNTVAFVEVKTRVGDQFGLPVEAVTTRKQRDIARVACAWIDRFGDPDQEYRFDVVGVTFRGPKPRVQHIEDAFRLNWRITGIRDIFG